VTSDPFSAESIEILRGPATLLYGSSAIGGVVNVIGESIPHSVPDQAVTGHVDLRGSSNADERAGGVSLGGGGGALAWHLNGFKRETDDYESGAGLVVNSDLEVHGGSGGVSVVGRDGFLGVSATQFKSKYGNPAEEIVHLEMDQKRYDLEGEWNHGFGPFRGARLRVGHNDYEHTEFEGEEVGTAFFDDGTEGRIELLHPQLGLFSGSVGLQYKQRDFEAVGEEAFVQPTSTDTWAAFLLEEVGSGAFRFQFGLRYDNQDTSVEAPDLPDRSFAATSGSAGFVWNQPGYGVGLTLSRSAKLPNAVELYANGPHIATLAFEIGNPDLKEEIGLGGDLTLRKTAGRARGEVSLFANRIDDYIFEQFTGELEGEEGGDEEPLRVIRFAQRDAEFRGAEGRLNLELVHSEPHHLSLDLGADYVRAKLRDTGEPLPRIPPLRYSAGLRYASTHWGAGVEWRRAEEQDRVAEAETKTPGYDLVNANLSYRAFWGGQIHDFVLRGSNLNDELARNHVSFLKDVAPLPGRDVSLSYRLSF
jgi:iron complex outermembrane receptor protein